MIASRPESLHKYCDVETALDILNSRKLKWESPSSSGNPFELTEGEPLDFSIDDLRKAALKRATNLLFTPEDPPGATPLMFAIRRWRAEERFESPEEAESVLGDLLSPNINQREEWLEGIMSAWRNFCQQLRISSMFSEHNSLSTWASHGDNFTGVALRLAVGADTSMPKPIQVQYADRRPRVVRLEQEIDFLLNGKEYFPEKHFLENFVVKPKLYTAEKEWRCFSKSRHSDTVQPYDKRSFKSDDLEAVYLGPKIEETAANNIMAIMEQWPTDVKIYRGQLSHQEYELQFTRLDKRPEHQT